MADFVSVSLSTDPTQLVDDGLVQINQTLAAAGYPGWTARDAQLAVIVMGVVAQWAADAASVASSVLPAVFRAFGTQLANIPYQQGVYASVQTTWVFTGPAPAGGYVIDTGRAMIISGQTFYVQTAVTTPAGATSAAVFVIAADTGQAYDGLGGIEAPVTLNDQIDWVQSVTTIGYTSGGADQETDDDYQNKLVNVLQLQAPRPITAADHAAFVQSTTCAQATGVVVGRATALDAYYPAPRTISGGGTAPASMTATGTTTSASTSVTSLTPFYPGAIPDIGAVVTGAGIPAGTTVAQTPAPTATAFTLSSAATASGSGVVLTIGAFRNVPRAVTTFVTDILGNPLTAVSMDALQAWLASYREANFLEFVQAPSYSQTYVSAQIQVLPGYAPTAVTQNVQNALLVYLNPATWGNPTGPTTGSQAWLNSGQGFNVVRFNKVLGLVENTPGVDYVPNGALTLGFAAAPAGVSDLTMPGPAPLPTSTAATIVVTSV